MRTLLINGARLAVEEAGSGPAVLCLHAGVADRRMWQPQWEWLSRHFRVVRYDQRGFGESPLPPGPFSLPRDALGVLDSLGIERATLIGCSMGGSSALHIAASHPERVERLVLIGSGLYGYEPRVPEPPLLAEADRALEAKDFERLLEIEEAVWVVGPDRARREVDPEFLALCRAMNSTALAYVGIQAESLERATTDVAALPEMAIPALVVVGTLDVPAILDTARYLVGCLPAARLEEIAGAAHLPSLERPGEFNAILANWLGVPAPHA